MEGITETETVEETGKEGGVGYSNCELIEGFISDSRLKGNTSDTIRTQGSRLRIIADFLGEGGYSFLDVDRFVLRDVLEYLRGEREVSFKTQRNYFSALSSFYRFLNFEGIYSVNPVPAFKRHYLRRYKNSYSKGEFQLVSVEDMSLLVNSILKTRDKALITLLAKTGIRLGELVSIDVDDIDWDVQSIKLKDKRKRSNRTVCFDEETGILLHRWLRVRDDWCKGKGKGKGSGAVTKALFVGQYGERLHDSGVYRTVRKHAQQVGLDDPQSDRLEDHFTPHCCRHWFTTHLRRNGMPREFIKELRGDSRKEAIDIYDHIDKKELRESYIAHIPRLGVA